MCQFFSSISDGKGKAYYFNAEQRAQIKTNKLIDNSKHKYYPDSHSSIAAYYKKNIYNAYEYNPFTRVFRIDRHNTTLKNDSCKIRTFCDKLDFKTIISGFRRNVRLPQRPKQSRQRVSKSNLLLLKEFVLHYSDFSIDPITKLIYKYKSIRGYYHFVTAIIKGSLYPKRQAKAVKAACELYKCGFTVVIDYSIKDFRQNVWCLRNKKGKVIRRITTTELKKIK